MAGKPLLREIAEKVLGEDVARRIWKRIDIIGDIVVIRKPFEMSVDELRPLGEALLERIPYARSVWLATSPVDGQYRLRDLVHLAGERRTETLYVEHGCKFRLDITKVYISLRLSYEHRRIASLVEDGERLLNMYAGAGFFSIIAACWHDIIAYSIDINPHAYRYMVLNARLNGVEDRVAPILGDAYSTTLRMFKGEVERVLMPLPELALQHLPAAIAALAGKGFIHIYLHVTAMSSREAIGKAVRLAVNRASRYASRVRVDNARVVRTVGPREYQVVVDMWVERNGANL